MAVQEYKGVWPRLPWGMIISLGIVILVFGPMNLIAFFKGSTTYAFLIAVLIAFFIIRKVG